MACTFRFSPQDATTNPSLILKAASLPEYGHLIADAIDYALAATEAGVSDKVDIAMDRVAVNFGAEISKIVPGCTLCCILWRTFLKHLSMLTCCIQAMFQLRSMRGCLSTQRPLLLELDESLKCTRSWALTSPEYSSKLPPHLRAFVLAKYWRRRASRATSHCSSPSSRRPRVLRPVSLSSLPSWVECEGKSCFQCLIAF